LLDFTKFGTGLACGASQLRALAANHPSLRQRERAVLGPLGFLHCFRRFELGNLGTARIFGALHIVICLQTKRCVRTDAALTAHDLDERVLRIGRPP